MIGRKEPVEAPVHPAWRTFQRGLDSRNAVILTVAYADVFDFAPNLSEIHRDLIGVSTDFEPTREMVGALVKDQVLIRAGDLIALPGREELLSLRDAVAARARELWPIARRVGRIIATFPFVRVVAVTGSLAADNPGPGADLDYLIITAPGHLWTVRAMAVGLVHLGRLAGIEVCPNYLLTTSVLELDRRDLFTAHELLQATPVAGQATYRRFLARNAWARHWLPNRWDATESARSAPGHGYGLQRFGEATLAGALGDRIERWERGRKVPRLIAGGAGGRFTADVCEGHYRRGGRRARRALAERCARLGLPPEIVDDQAPYVPELTEAALPLGQFAAETVPRP